jgi:hypothetical protein
MKKILLLVLLFSLGCSGVYAEETLDIPAEVIDKLTKKNLTLTEIEVLKLSNIDLKTKDLHNQFANLKRNLGSALQQVSKEKGEIIKGIEERLGLEEGKYEIKGDLVVLKEKKDDK